MITIKNSPQRINTRSPLVGDRGLRSKITMVAPQKPIDEPAQAFTHMSIGRQNAALKKSKMN